MQFLIDKHTFLHISIKSFLYLHYSTAFGKKILHFSGFVSIYKRREVRFCTPHVFLDGSSRKYKPSNSSIANTTLPKKGFGTAEIKA